MNSFLPIMYLLYHNIISYHFFCAYRASTASFKPTNITATRNLNLAWLLLPHKITVNGHGQNKPMPINFSASVLRENRALVNLSKVTLGLHDMIYGHTIWLTALDPIETDTLDKRNTTLSNKISSRAEWAWLGVLGNTIVGKCSVEVRDCSSRWETFERISLWLLTHVWTNRWRITEQTGRVLNITVCQKWRSGTLLKAHGLSSIIKCTTSRSFSRR